jgi:hypothetical protein
MNQPTAGEPMDGDSGRDVAARSAQRRMLDQVAARAPGHRLTVEAWPGRRDRFVARAITPTARPYLVVTDDLNELSSALDLPPASAGTGDEKP